MTTKPDVGKRIADISGLSRLSYKLKDELPKTLRRAKQVATAVQMYVDVTTGCPISNADSIRASKELFKLATKVATDLVDRSVIKANNLFCTVDEDMDVLLVPVFLDKDKNAFSAYIERATICYVSPRESQLHLSNISTRLPLFHSPTGQKTITFHRVYGKATKNTFGGHMGFHALRSSMFQLEARSDHVIPDRVFILPTRDEELISPLISFWGGTTEGLRHYMRSTSDLVAYMQMEIDAWRMGAYRVSRELRQTEDFRDLCDIHWSVFFDHGYDIVSRHFTGIPYEKAQDIIKSIPTLDTEDAYLLTIALGLDWYKLFFTE